MRQSSWQRQRSWRRSLKKASVTLSIKAGEGGRAFGSVSSKEIAEGDQGAAEDWRLTRRKLLLNEPIKTFGSL